MNGFAIRSTGAPFFAFAQSDLVNMDAAGLNGDGLCVLEIEVMVHALPVQYASSNERHTLIGVAEYGFSGSVLHELGIGPDGSVSAQVLGGANAVSAPAKILSGSPWKVLRSEYDPAGGDLRVYVDGVPVASDSDGGAQPVPASTRVAQMQLFNGKDGITRCDCSIRSALVETGPGPFIVWNMLKRGESVLVPDDSDGLDAINPALTASWVRPPFPPAEYGEVPAPGTEGDAFRWWTYTDWEEEEVPATSWVEEES